MAVQIEGILNKTARSDEILKLAEKYLDEAEKLEKGDERRIWLETELKFLIAQANLLTSAAKLEISQYKTLGTRDALTG